MDDYLKDISKIFKGTSITLVGSFSGKICAFLFALILAKIYSPREVGLFFLTFIIYRFCLLVCNMGLVSGTIRYVAIYQQNNKSAHIKGTLLSGWLITFLMTALFLFTWYFSGSYVAVTFFEKEIIYSYLLVFLFALPFESMMKINLAALRAIEKVEYQAYVEGLLFNVLKLSFVLYMLFEEKLDVIYVIYFYVVSAIIVSVLSFYLLKSNFKLTFFSKDYKCEFKELISFSIPMALTGILNDIMAHIDILILGIFVTSYNVGIYSVLTKITSIVQVFFYSFIPIFQSFAVNLTFSNDIKRLSNLLKAVAYLKTVLCAPVFCLLLLFPQFALAPFGEEYLIGIEYLYILIAANFALCYTILPAAIISMSGRSKLTSVNNFVLLIINGSLNLLLIPKYGLYGAAISTCISFVSFFIIINLQVYKIFNFSFLSTLIVKPLMISLLLYLVSCFIARDILANTITDFIYPLGFIATFILMSYLTIGKREKEIFNSIFLKNTLRKRST